MGSPTDSPNAPEVAIAPAIVDHDAQIASAVEQRATLARAIHVVNEVCEEISRAAKVKNAQAAQALVPSGPSGLTVHAEIMARQAAEEKWKAMLDDDMKELKNNIVIGKAFRIAVHQDFEAERANLRQLTAVQVRSLRTELFRLERLWGLAQAKLWCLPWFMRLTGMQRLML